MAKDAFLGAWLVLEHIYNPDGSIAGLNRQRRALYQKEGGRILVIQVCEPDKSLNGHPMEAFAGEWVFELEVDGRLRRYLGPDVVGVGLSWGQGAMTGRGLWPRFGYGFQSYAFLPEAGRQLTGGRFQVGPQLVANIAGIAMGEENAAAYPAFFGPQAPSELAGAWSGSRRVLLPGGELLEERDCRREYAGSQYNDGEDELRVDGERLRGRIAGKEAKGLIKQYGWMTEWEAVVGGRRVVETTEILDPAGGHLVAMRKWYLDQRFEKIEWIALRPEKRKKETEY